jgi:ZIP family zinc transporter
MVNTAIGLLLPFAGTALGAAMVFLLRNELSARLQKLLLGFASGVMMAASVWSLLLPSIDIATEQGVTAWLPAACGFVGGMLFLLVLDTLIPHLHVNSQEAEGVHSSLGRSAKLILAVTLHNIPEGMAVGVVFAGAMVESVGISLAGAMALSLGIAIQNFPEGAIISMPLKGEGHSKGRSFLYGALSGIVEPIAAIITILLIEHLLPALPFLLAFSAGAMIYVVVEELIPESQSGKHSNIATIGVAAGFTLMMILDVALG